MIGDVWEWTSSEYVLILALNPDFQNILTSGLLTKKFFKVAVLPRLQNKSEIATEITLG